MCCKLIFVGGGAAGLATLIFWIGRFWWMLSVFSHVT
jgi:hypothetical protein